VKKHEVIQKTEVHNVSQRRHSIGKRQHKQKIW